MFDLALLRESLFYGPYLVGLYFILVDCESFPGTNQY